jgi:uncharacterized protein YjbI with pentapeptide repeats
MRILITKSFALLSLGVLIFTAANAAIAQQVRDHRDARPQVRDHRDTGVRVRDHRVTTPDPSVRPAVSTISNFQAVDVSGNEMRVTVEYDYGGERGTSDVYITASALQADGSAVPGLVDDVTFAEANVGRGSATNTLTMKQASGRFTSTHVNACITHRFSGSIICRTFQSTKSWMGEAELSSLGTAPPGSPETGAWSQADLDRLNRLNQCPGCNLQEVMLAKADLRGSDVREANLRSANLSFANLGRAVLNAADLHSATMHNANLEEAWLQSVILLQGDLRVADLRRAKMQGASLGGANLVEANLSFAVLTGAVLTGANLTKAHMERSILHRTDMRGAKLERAVLWSSDLSRAMLVKADLSAAYLQNANLERADLRQANLKSANLQNAVLTFANLEGANLRGADLAGAVVKVAKLAGAIWPDGTVCLPGSVGGCLYR